MIGKRHLCYYVKRFGAINCFINKNEVQKREMIQDGGGTTAVSLSF